MKTSASILIDAPLETVWRAALEQFDQISLWSSGVITSQALDTPTAVPGAPFAGRLCTTPIGELQETFVSLDAAKHQFTYVLQSDAFPSFMLSARNSWQIRPFSTNQTELTMIGDTTLNLFPGQLMRLPLWLQSKKALKNNLEEFKHFVETGRPHPRKQAAQPALQKSFS